MGPLSTYRGFLVYNQGTGPMPRLNFATSHPNRAGCSPVAYVAWVGALILMSWLALYQEASAGGIQNLAVGSAEIYNPANGLPMWFSTPWSRPAMLTP